MGNVMSGIAEALVATGVGLFVALPAVVAYNVMQQAGRRHRGNVAIISKHAAGSPQVEGQAGRRAARTRRTAFSAKVASTTATSRAKSCHGRHARSANSTEPRGASTMAGTLVQVGRGGHGAIVGINVTPMVDVVLVLLVIMMVSATYIVSQSLKVELPKTASSDEAVQSWPRSPSRRTASIYLQSGTVSEPALDRQVQAAALPPTRYELDRQRGSGRDARQGGARDRSGQAAGHHQVRHQRGAR